MQPFSFFFLVIRCGAGGGGDFGSGSGSKFNCAARVGSGRVRRSRVRAGSGFSFEPVQTSTVYTVYTHVVQSMFVSRCLDVHHVFVCPGFQFFCSLWFPVSTSLLLLKPAPFGSSTFNATFVTKWLTSKGASSEDESSSKIRLQSQLSW